MKPILRYTLLLTLIICFTTCKKDDNGASTTLPEATQEGKNTFGMKVNGKVWTPYFSCGSFSNPCGAVEFTYNQTNNFLYNISLGSAQRINGKNSTFGFYTLNNASITTIGNKYDSIYMTYIDYSATGSSWIDYKKSNMPKGNFIITKIDSIKKIVSGTFDFTLYNGSDSVMITEGRFDYKFYTCLCNN